MKRIPIEVKFGGKQFIRIPVYYKVLSKEKKLLAILGNHKIETDFENINNDLKKIVEEIRRQNYGDSTVLVETTFIPINNIELEIVNK